MRHAFAPARTRLKGEALGSLHSRAKKKSPLKPGQEETRAFGISAGRMAA